jgi:aminoglycoside phosphotransferase (APT) family kinase protein
MHTGMTLEAVMHMPMSILAAHGIGMTAWVLRSGIKEDQKNARHADARNRRAPMVSKHRAADVGSPRSRAMQQRRRILGIPFVLIYAACWRTGKARNPSSSTRVARQSSSL